jgi:hypothetical protein
MSVSFEGPLYGEYFIVRINDCLLSLIIMFGYSNIIIPVVPYTNPRISPTLSLKHFEPIGSLRHTSRIEEEKWWRRERKIQRASRKETVDTKGTIVVSSIHCSGDPGRKALRRDHPGTDTTAQYRHFCNWLDGCLRCRPKGDLMV